MGQHNAHIAGVSNAVAVFLQIVILLTAFALNCNSDSGKEASQLPEIKELIKSFRSGEEFDGNAEPFIINGQPDSNALAEFRTALQKEDDHVREQIFHILAGIGKRIDPLFDKGGDLIRDRSIITLFIREGLSRKSSTRDYCIDRLQYSVPAAILKEYGKQLSDNLRMWPDATLLLVVAKAKAPDAKEVVDSLMKISGWAQEIETRIAAAALGDMDLESTFIKAFQTATTPEEKKDAARYLGFIGTPDALKALASDMRTDMVLEMTRVSKRSVRIFIIEALHYNYPDMTFLFDNAVNSDEDYARIEKFCEETFGITWTKERPPFLWIQGFPSNPRNSE